MKLRDRNSIINPNFDPGENHEIPFEDITIQNPFKSKLKQGTNTNSDLSIKAQQKHYQRPYFSPNIHSWECDLVFISNNPNMKDNVYLFLVNINTRYLHIVLLHNKDEQSILRAFQKLIYYGLKINSIRFDDEKSFNGDVMTNYFNSHNISVYHNSSPYINKNRIVDRVIRTIRDMYYNWHSSVNFKQIDRQKQHNILQQLVTIYNNSYHTSIKMKPVEMTIEKELEYIKQKQEQLSKIKLKQYNSGFYSFKHNEPIKIYLNESKTNNAFKKRRGNYIHDATFLYYDHGNAVVKFGNKIITIPIFWIKNR